MENQSFQTVNPATGEVLDTYLYLSDADIKKRLSFSFECYLKNKTKPIAIKKAQLKALAEKLRLAKEDLALVMTREMGKALVDSEAEIEKCAVTADYFSRTIDQFIADERVLGNYPTSMVIKNSLGPLFAIMPWNFPLWQIVRVLVPAIGVGNPVLLKHSDITAGTGRALQKICDEIEPGLLIHLLVSHEQAAEIIADPCVRAVTLTGSAKAGRQISALAGKNLKKTVLELGGSDAYLVLEDADLDKAAKICAQARMVNNGQSCVAAKRFIVHNSVKDKFLHKFCQELKKFKPGNPEDKTTLVGTLASKKFQQALLRQCEVLEQLGAKKVFDGDPGFDFNSERAYFPARVYQIETDLPEAHTEEFFGPVALVFSFDEDVQAVEMANQSIYGLGGAVFSRDIERAEQIARLMECGMVAINDQVKSDARLPFGGVKDSGYGRELGVFGVNEFSNIKSLGIGH